MLKQGHLHLLWWRALKLAHGASRGLAHLRLWAVAVLLRPMQLAERRRGRAVEEMAFVRKKCLILCTLIFAGGVGVCGWRLVNS